MGNFPKSILRIILVITTLLDIVVLLVHSQVLEYPKVRRDEGVVDDYHGTRVQDPYRWMEERDSDKVSEFVGTQNELGFNYLRDCQQRKESKERLHELWAYPKYGRPEKRGSRYFYFAQQKGGEVLYVQHSKESLPRVLIDPDDNGVLAFPSFGASRDGEMVAYKEIVTIEGIPKLTGNLRILNVTSKDVYPDILEDLRNPQVAWDKDSRGFFYFSHRRYDESDEEDEDPQVFYIYYHKVGTRTDRDVLVIDYADFPDEPDFVDMEVSKDGEYLLLRTKSYIQDPSGKGLRTNNSTFYVANLTNYVNTGVTQKVKLIPVVNRQTSAFVKYVTNIGSRFFFRSKIEAKNYRLIEIDLTNPSESKWRVVIEENSNYVLQSVVGVDKSKVVLSYNSPKLNSYAELRDLENGSLIRMFPLQFGELLSFSGHIDDSELLFRSTKLEGLPELFYFDVRDPKGPMKTLVPQPSLTNYDSSQFKTEVVTFPSPVTGENVEMILLYRKNLSRDGSAYAFIVEREFDLDFYFRIYFSYMSDFNAVVAFPHLEEENGRGFRDAALQDFIAAAEYLVKEGYSSGSRIITRGQSTFGLFVASALNHRPELFGAAVLSMVPFDMLRYDAATNWTAASKEDPESFNTTYSISPLHNIRVPLNESVQYPGIFIPTPNQYPIPYAFKYLAELQHTLGRLPQQKKPFLMRVVPEPSLAAGDIYFSRYHIDREAEIRCFLEKVVGLQTVY